MDACRVNRPAPPVTAVTRLEKMLGYLRLDARIYRYRFNLQTGETKEEELDDVNTEFPSINSSLLGQKSRYAYNVSITSDTTLLFDGLIKYDTERGTSEKFSFGKGRYGSEATFAPRTNAVCCRISSSIAGRSRSLMRRFIDVSICIHVAFTALQTS